MTSLPYYCEGCIHLSQAQNLIQQLLHSLEQQQNSALHVTQMVQDQQRQLDEVRGAISRMISVTQIEILSRIGEVHETADKD